tara:strand:- start:666 stop:833 length:168 start_codon:yes stop_codon:yes gene_type:complete
MEIIIFFCGVFCGAFFKLNFIVNKKNKIEQNLKQFDKKNHINPKMFLTKDELKNG